VWAHHGDIPEKLAQSIRKEFGARAEIRLYQWQELIHANLDAGEGEKLELVNDFFNGARFIDDRHLWGQRDYWATPTEFLARDAGDCEDFSVAKYFTLKAMGVDISKMRLTYVKSLTLDQAHMVLAYYPTPSSVPLVLDNVNKRIKPATERPDLVPVYSFNADNLWLSRSRNEQVRAGNPSNLGQWRKLLQRMHKNNPESP
jgi:predicted transglutaminase-like cysteine proteinase